MENVVYQIVEEIGWTVVNLCMLYFVCIKRRGVLVILGNYWTSGKFQCVL